jgi:hypothetical protein
VYVLADDLIATINKVAGVRTHRVLMLNDVRSLAKLIRTSVVCLQRSMNIHMNPMQ